MAPASAPTDRGGRPARPPRRRTTDYATAAWVAPLLMLVSVPAAVALGYLSCTVLAMLGSAR